MADDRHGGEVVGRRRRGDRPLERRGVPWVVTGDFAVLEAIAQVVDEQEHRSRQEHGAEADDHVPELPTAALAVGVVAARHALQPEEVHREEGRVEADECQSRS